MQQAAVIILNWNGAQLLDRYLPELIAHTPTQDIRLIVADNGSTDSSRELVESKYPEVEFLALDQNYGFAGGYNRAIELIEAPLLCLLNSDVRVAPNWYKAPIETLNAHPTVAAVQPKILAIRQKGKFEYAGAAGGMIDKWGYPFCRGRIFDTLEVDEGQYEGDPIDVFWASGACLWVRREVYMEVGGLDEGFFAHQEEIDLCWRLQRRGYRIQVATASVVYHLGGASLDMNHPHKLYLNFRNNLLMLYKNYPSRGFHRLMTVRMMLDLLSSLQQILTFKPAHSSAILRAIWDYYRIRKSFADRRTQDYRPLAELACPPMRLSIVWQYFVSRRKRFQDLP